MGLTNNELIAAAKQLGCDVAAIRAVDQVESGGRGFVASGQIVLRFETHLFLKETGVTISGYNRAAFDKAAKINRTAAIRSTSWGRYQILGSNYKSCGYASPEAYLQGMLKGESYQLKAFVSLLLDWGLHLALRNHDWLTFARRYNGAGEAKANPPYHTKLLTAYQTFSKQAFPATTTVTPLPSPPSTFTVGTAILALVCLVLLAGSAYVSYRGLWPQVWRKIDVTAHKLNPLNYA